MSFAGWRDTELELDCYFHVAEDGRWRCVPLTANGFFGDADCTVPAGATIYGDINPDFASFPVYPTASCSPSAAWVGIYRIGAETAPTRSWVATSLGCVEQTLGSGARTFLVSEHITPETFVGAAPIDEPRAGRLAARTLVADDGARQTVEVVDTATGSVCSFYRLGDELRCWGAGVQRTDGFGDATCSEPAAIRLSECPAPTLLLARDARSCATSRAFHAGPSSTLHGIDPSGACVPSTPEVPGVRIGAELDASEIDAAAPRVRELRLGTGPLRTAAIADEAGVLLRPWWGLITAEGLRCMSWVDGTCRLDYTPAAGFADPECTRPLSRSGPPCGDGSRNAVRNPVTGELHDVGERYDGIVYQQVAPGRCEVDPTASSYAGPFYLAGETVSPPSTLVVRRLD